MSTDRPEFGQPLPRAPRKRRSTAPAKPADEDRVDDDRDEAASRLSASD